MAIFGNKKNEEREKIIKDHIEKNNQKIEKQQNITVKSTDALGKLELEILKEFENFSDTMERIQGRPDFAQIRKDIPKISSFKPDEIKQVSMGANALIGSLGGAAVGTASGFAAAGVTTAAVATFGTASTGVAISSLSGAALTNATLACIGGGSLAAGGGGIALGTTILGATTFGVGLLVGAAFFGIVMLRAHNAKNNIDKELQKMDEKTDEICKFLAELKDISDEYQQCLKKVFKKYKDQYSKMVRLVGKKQHTDYNSLKDKDKLIIKNTIMLADLLYKMCSLNLVNKPRSKNSVNTINMTGINAVMLEAKKY